MILYAYEIWRWIRASDYVTGFRAGPYHFVHGRSGSTRCFAGPQPSLLRFALPSKAYRVTGARASDIIVPPNIAPFNLCPPINSFRLSCSRLGLKYYAGLLSAAQYPRRAAHHRPQIFQVMVGKAAPNSEWLRSASLHGFAKISRKRSTELQYAARYYSCFNSRGYLRLIWLDIPNRSAALIRQLLPK